MNVVDSSCWLEYFAGSKVGDEVSTIIEDVQNLLVPSITLYEVFKKLLIELDEDKAIFAIAHMKQGRVVELYADLAVFAAQMAKELKLPMADSIIYATTRRHSAILYTQDRHFENLESVKLFQKA